MPTLFRSPSPDIAHPLDVPIQWVIASDARRGESLYYQFVRVDNNRTTPERAAAYSSLGAAILDGRDFAAHQLAAVSPDPVRTSPWRDRDSAFKIFVRFGAYYTDADGRRIKQPSQDSPSVWVVNAVVQPGEAFADYTDGFLTRRPAVSDAGQAGIDWLAVWTDQATTVTRQARDRFGASLGSTDFALDTGGLWRIPIGRGNTAGLPAGTATTVWSRPGQSATQTIRISSHPCKGVDVVYLEGPGSYASITFDRVEGEAVENADLAYDVLPVTFDGGVTRNSRVINDEGGRRRETTTSVEVLTATVTHVSSRYLGMLRDLCDSERCYLVLDGRLVPAFVRKGGNAVFQRGGLNPVTLTFEKANARRTR